MTIPPHVPGDPWYTEKSALRETATRFAEREILPHLAEWEAAGRIPRELHRKAGELGLLGVSFPEESGGGGGDEIDSLVVCEALHEAGVAGGVFASLFTCGIAVPHLARSGRPDQIERWVAPTLAGEMIGSLAITEPGGGSDVGHLTTTARRDGDHYVVDGAKTYITSATRADFVVTAVRTGGDELAGAAGVSLLVIPTDTPGVHVSAPLDKLGWRASDTAELTFTTAACRSTTSCGERRFARSLRVLGTRGTGLPGLFLPRCLTSRWTGCASADVRSPAAVPPGGAEHGHGDGTPYRRARTYTGTA